MNRNLSATEFKQQIEKIGRLSPLSGRMTLCVDLQNNLFYTTANNEIFYLEQSERDRFLKLSTRVFDYHYKTRE